MILYAKRINHGQSEVRLDNGPTRITATNNLTFAVKKNCDDATARNFWGAMPTLGDEGALTANVEEVAAYLGIS